MKAYQSQYGTAFATKGGQEDIIEEEAYENYSEDDFEESDDHDSDNNNLMAGGSGSTAFNTAQKQAMETS